MEVVGPGNLSAGGGDVKHGGLPKHAPRVFRFAAFELRTGTRELLRNGIHIKLQIKPFQVLEALLENPGELVTRDELRHKLWPSGTFVDFESGLNTAINRLRVALGDSAEAPRYIETLPRLGYRFISRVQTLGNEIAISDATPESPSLPAVVAPLAVDAPLSERIPVSAAVFAIAITLLVFGLLLAGFVYQFPARHSAPEFSPVSFRGGALISARFLSGSRIIYSARLNGVRQSFVSDIDGSNDYALPIRGIITSVSQQGDLAILSEDSSKAGCPIRLLIRSSLNGRRAETLTQNASLADWGPDGKQLAVVREVGTNYLLEFPVGAVIYRSQGWIDSVRVSRNGREVAFLEHPVRDDDAGHLRIVDAAGHTVLVTKDWGSAAGLAWSASGTEVWVTASNEAGRRTLYAVPRSGRIRALSTQPQSLRLLDVSSSGHALLAIDDTRLTMRAAVSENEPERDISQFDFSHIDDISQNGSVLLFTEAGDAGGQHYTAFVYDQSTHKVKRLGSGRGLSLSPDGTQALTIDPQHRTALNLIDLPGGRSATLPASGFQYQWARFFKPGQLLVGGAYPGRPLTICSMNQSNGALVPIPAAPYLDYVAVSPDGTKIAGRLTGHTEIFDLATKTTHRLLPEASSLPIGWSADGKNLFLVSMDQPAYSILKLNVATGQSRPWKTIVPQNKETFIGLAAIVAAPASGAYAYSASQQLSRLYLVDGIS